jgi:hypothetical protein
MEIPSVFQTIAAANPSCFPFCADSCDRIAARSWRVFEILIPGLQSAVLNLSLSDLMRLSRFGVIGSGKIFPSSVCPTPITALRACIARKSTYLNLVACP